LSIILWIKCKTSVGLLLTNLSFLRLVSQTAEAYVRRTVEYSQTRKVDRTRLFHFERCAAPAPILSCFGGSCVLDTLGVLLYVPAYHPCVEVVDKAEDPVDPIDLSLD
jgi:hypothetical protein